MVIQVYPPSVFHQTDRQGLWAGCLDGPGANHAAGALMGRLDGLARLELG